MNNFSGEMRDPLNDMSVKDYNDMLIAEKKGQLAGARAHLIKTMEDITGLEKELIALVLEQVHGYKFPEAQEWAGVRK